MLVGTLKRQCLFAFAEAGLCHLACSVPVLDEAERALAAMLAARGHADAASRAQAIRTAMQDALPEACLAPHPRDAAPLPRLRDTADAHVIAAALRAGASVIVTDNLADFTPRVLGPLALRAVTADAFLAALATAAPGEAAAAVARMRARWHRPDKTPARLLSDLRAGRLPATARALARLVHKPDQPGAATPSAAARPGCGSAA